MPQKRREFIVKWGALYLTVDGHEVRAGSEVRNAVMESARFACEATDGPAQPMIDASCGVPHERHAIRLTRCPARRMLLRSQATLGRAREYADRALAGHWVGRLFGDCTTRGHCPSKAAPAATREKATRVGSQTFHIRARRDARLRGSFHTGAGHYDDRTEQQQGTGLAQQAMRPHHEAPSYDDGGFVARPIELPRFTLGLERSHAKLHLAKLIGRHLCTEVLDRFRHVRTNAACRQPE
jgi:hypothetical protein